MKNKTLFSSCIYRCVDVTFQRLLFSIYYFCPFFAHFRILQFFFQKFTKLDKIKSLEVCPNLFDDLSQICEQFAQNYLFPHFFIFRFSSKNCLILYSSPAKSLPESIDPLFRKSTKSQNIKLLLSLPTSSRSRLFQDFYFRKHSSKIDNY